MKHESPTCICVSVCVYVYMEYMYDVCFLYSLLLYMYIYAEIINTTWIIIKYALLGKNIGWKTCLINFLWNIKYES